MSSLSQTLEAKPPPVREDAEGVLRVGGTRVTLDVVIHAYQRGCAPTDIVRMYDVLKLADVHGVISYYLENQAVVDDYLARREHQAEDVRREIDARSPYAEFRAKMKARKTRS